MAEVIRVEISLEWWTWRTPEFVLQLEADTKQVIEVEDRPEPSAKDDVITNQEDLDRWDKGLRRLTYSNKFSIDFGALLKYLPCTVVGVQQTVTSESLEQRVAPVMNDRVKVVVPGPALLSYNEVQVEVDCCTDRLQSSLNDGWRILAICVQPDQRRPDFVLGRVNEELLDDLALSLASLRVRKR